MLPDGKTLLGGSGLFVGVLQTEDITQEKSLMIIDQGSYIFTMIFNQSLNSLLIGNINRSVLQYERDSSGILRKKKDYGDIGVGCVLASDSSGDFAVVGGDNGIIKLIDMRTRKVFEKGIETAIGRIESLQFCRVSTTEMHLVVGGRGRNYSDSKTDLFDLSKLFQFEAQEMHGQNHKLSANKINHQANNQQLLIQEIHKLKMDLQREKQNANQMLNQNTQLKQKIELLQNNFEKQQKSKNEALSKIATLNLQNLQLQNKNLKLSQQLQKIIKNLKIEQSILFLKHTKHIIDKANNKYGQ